MPRKHHRQGPVRLVVTQHEHYPDDWVVFDEAPDEEGTVRYWGVTLQRKTGLSAGGFSMLLMWMLPVTSGFVLVDEETRTRVLAEREAVQQKIRAAMAEGIVPGE